MLAQELGAPLLLFHNKTDLNRGKIAALISRFPVSAIALILGRYAYREGFRGALEYILALGTFRRSAGCKKWSWAADLWHIENKNAGRR